MYAMQFLIVSVNIQGGHLGPNLGVVEMTIALHKVFNSPVDKLIWDVSHQSYPHKVLTGRKEFFTDKDKFSGTTGYTDPEENEHDFIRVGHTSTSIATAMDTPWLEICKEKKKIL